MGIHEEVINGASVSIPIKGYRQVERHGTLTSRYVGSNPTSPVKKFLKIKKEVCSHDD